MTARQFGIPAIVVALVVTPAVLRAQTPMGTAFTYQGQLNQVGIPVNDPADFEFTLWDAAVGGSQEGPLVPMNNVTVIGGLFTIVLDFGSNVFSSDARWLEIAVRVPAGGGNFTTLSPRQELTPTPYAIYAATAGTDDDWMISGQDMFSIPAGNVGIGIRPSEKLDVLGNIHASGRITSGTSITLDGANDKITASSGTLSFDNENIVTTGKATIGSGHTNTGAYAFVAGRNNVASHEAVTISGGSGNRATQHDATIAGGSGNTAGEEATVGGGVVNTASGFCATVAGGAQNTAGTANYPFGTVGGGSWNVASGPYSTVPGGNYNTAAGSYSFAAGRRARANAGGSFVWGDSTNADVACNSSNRWVARASGGVYFYSNSGCSSGVYVAAGGNSWNAISDRATKENFRPVDTRGILEQLAGLPLQTYKLKSQGASIRHIGPVAQDFYGVFGYGESDKAINMEDAHGVTLAAIQGMYELVNEKDAEIGSLRARLDALEALVAELAGSRDGGAE